MIQARGELALALALLAVSGFFVAHLLGRPGAAGTVVSTTTLPLVCALALVALASLMVVSALWRPPVEATTAEGDTLETPGAAPAGRWRVPVMVAWTALYVATLPWLGYLVASGAFLAGLTWLYGMRHLAVIGALVVLVPLTLLLFFERVMIVLLPTARLLD